MASRVDPVTGLNVFIKGIGKLGSGKVYKGNAIAVNSINAIDYWAENHQSARIQWQFENNYIAITEDASAVDETTRRWVIYGDFTYKNGTIASATINKFYDIYMRNDGALDFEDEGYSAKFKGGYKFADPGKISSWSILSDLEGNAFETGNYHGDKVGWSKFSNFANGKFFALGWESDPFTLI